MSNPPAISITSPIDGTVHLTNLVMDTPSTLQKKLSLAASTQAELRHTAFAQRELWLLHAADLLELEADRLAAIMTLEMGKTLASARAEAIQCATVCRYYATYAALRALAATQTLVPAHATGGASPQAPQTSPEVQA